MHARNDQYVPNTKYTVYCKSPHSLAITFLAHMLTGHLSYPKSRCKWIWKTVTGQTYLSLSCRPCSQRCLPCSKPWGAHFAASSIRSVHPRANRTNPHYRANALLEAYRNGSEFFRYAPAPTFVVSVQGHDLLLQYR